MTERYEHADGYFTGSGRPPRPTLWLAAIPMLVVSLIGLFGGHTVNSKAGAGHTEGTPGADEVTVSSQDLEARPKEELAARVPPAASATTHDTTVPTTVAATAPITVTTTPTIPEAAPSENPEYGCAAALRWLSAHSAPGFRFECPGNALGHQAMTCVNVENVCPGQRIIAIADACPAAYMNEAHNSWILAGLATGRLDPYGYCG